MREKVVLPSYSSAIFPESPRPCLLNIVFQSTKVLAKEKWCFSWGIPKGLEPGRGELEFLFFAFQKVVYSPGTVISPTVKRTIVRI